MSGELVRYERTPSGLHVRPTLNLSLSGLNLFGNLGRVLGEVILYRIEARRSHDRLRELQARAGVATRIIDAHTRMAVPSPSHDLVAELRRALPS